MAENGEPKVKKMKSSESEIVSASSSDGCVQLAACSVISAAEGENGRNAAVPEAAANIQQQLQTVAEPAAASPAEPKEILYEVVIAGEGRVWEELPDGWISLLHQSGMPVYIHRQSRVCTLARPYCIAGRNLQKHDLPIAGIPCLLYQSEKDKDGGSGDLMSAEGGEQASGGSETTADSMVVQQSMSAAPAARDMQSPKAYISPKELHNYCKRLFSFKAVPAPQHWTETVECEKRACPPAQMPNVAGGDDYKFMDTDEVLKLLVSAPALDSVPWGNKDNSSFVVHNEKNEERRARGKRSQFTDDCGSWCSKGATTSRTSFVVGPSGELKTAVYFYNGQWGSRRFVNAQIRFVALEPQPNASDLLVLFRYYSRLRKNPSFQRRISWVGQRPAWIAESVMGKAVYEYRGIQFGALPPPQQGADGSSCCKRTKKPKAEHAEAPKDKLCAAAAKENAPAAAAAAAAAASTVACDSPSVIDMSMPRASSTSKRNLVLSRRPT